MPSSRAKSRRWSMASSTSSAMKNGRKNSPVRAPAVPDGRGKSETSGEFAIIARYFAPLATNPAALGLLDDAAVLSIPAGQELVATCDTIISGVHFLAEDPPDSIGYKALAVSLSELAAKGARPHVYLLSVAFSERPSSAWLEALASGLRLGQDESGIDLVGGDTSATPGPLAITVTALGMLPRRGGVTPRRHGWRQPLCERRHRRCRARI